MDTEPSLRSIESRLDRLEELAGFADRRHDELNAALLDLAARLDRATRRITDIAARLDAVTTPRADKDDDDAPPNDAGAHDRTA